MMRNVLFAILMLITSAVALAEGGTQASAVQTTSQQKILKVNGMVCAFCAQGIEKKFKARSEVQLVRVSLEAKTVELQFHPGKSISDNELASILKEAGYEVVP